MNRVVDMCWEVQFHKNIENHSMEHHFVHCISFELFTGKPSLTPWTKKKKTLSPVSAVMGTINRCFFSFVFRLSSKGTAHLCAYCAWPPPPAFQVLIRGMGGHVRAHWDLTHLWLLGFHLNIHTAIHSRCMAINAAALFFCFLQKNVF